jgi:tetratricopeptide (TPR) repeat protein
MARPASHSHDSARSPHTLARQAATWPQFFRLAGLFAALLLAALVLSALLAGAGRSDGAEPTAAPATDEPASAADAREAVTASAPDLARLLPLGPERDQSVERELILMLANDLPAQAESACRERLQAHPDHPLLWLILGESLERQARWKEAFAGYGQALSLDPNLAPAHSRRGRLFCRFRQYEEARQECATALGLDPDDPLAHAYLGIACAYLGQREAAREHALRAEAAGLNMNDVWRKLAE